MGQGLGAAYHRKWRLENPEVVDRYARSVEGRYCQLKRAAKRGNREFTITVEQYRELLATGVCFYCGGPLSDYGYSLDRQDHHKGYTLDNVVPCCGSKNGSRQESCNLKKGHLECVGFTFPRTVELLRELLAKEQHERNTD